MAAPPTRSGGASLPGPEASADAASLRAYLAKDTHARVSRLSADDFTSWLERETLERLHRDRPAALRARADATRRSHRRTIFPLEVAVAAADAAFDASDDRARIAAAEKAPAQARAAIEGITAHLAREDAVSEPGTGPGRLAGPERGGARRRDGEKIRNGRNESPSPRKARGDRRATRRGARVASRLTLGARGVLGRITPVPREEAARARAAGRRARGRAWTPPSQKPGPPSAARVPSRARSARVRGGGPARGRAADPRGQVRGAGHAG